MNTCIERFDLVKGKAMNKCQFQVVIYTNANGVDMCEAMGLNEYPSVPCGNEALPFGKGFNMCEEHDHYADHWA